MPGPLRLKLLGASDAAWQACPADNAQAKATLAAGEILDVCALFPAPSGSTVTELADPGARQDGSRRQLGGATAITCAVPPAG